MQNNKQITTMVKVRNITSERSGESVRNQFIIKVDGVKYFQSYDTTIAKYDYRNNKLYVVRGATDYSTTTSKYFYKFLRDEVGLSVYSKKDFKRDCDECDAIIIVDEID